MTVSKKKSKKLKKKLQEKIPKQKTSKKVEKPKQEEPKQELETSEILDRLSQPEHQDIGELMREKSAETEEPLEKIAEQFITEEDEEKTIGSEYVQTGEYSKKYEEYKTKESDAYATNQQPTFEPIHTTQEDEDKKYHRAKKKDLY